MAPETVVTITVKTPDKFYGNLAYKLLNDLNANRTVALFMQESTITAQYTAERGRTKPELEQAVKDLGRLLRTKIPIPQTIEVSIKQHRTVRKDCMYTTVDTTVGIVLR